MQQILEVIGFVLIGVWVIALLATQVWYLVEMFRANVLLAILSLFVPFVGLYLLVRHWEDLKKPFLYQLSVVLVGGVAIMVFAVLLKGTLGSSLAAEGPPDEGAYQPEMAIIPTGSITAEVASLPTWGVEIPVGETALVSIPHGWSRMQWRLPDLEVAIGNLERGLIFPRDLLLNGARQGQPGKTHHENWA